MADYTHFTNLSFDNLFARKGVGQEVQVMDAAGNFSVGGISTTGNISVQNLVASGTITGTFTGNAATATALQTARNINGVSFNGTADVTVTAAAGTLTGTTLASNVTASSLTSVGTLGSLTVTAPITGSVTGNAANVTGVVAVANGGTNSSTALNNNRVMQSSGGKIQEAAAITASRALVSDANGIPTHATTTATEIGFVNGVTSAIQTQLNTKAAAATALLARIKVEGGNGFGSTNTVIRRFSTSVISSGGSDLTLNQSATNGDNITINTAGLYSISGGDSNVNEQDHGISRNSNQLTTAIASITNTHRLGITNADAGNGGSISWIGFCSAGDVIRLHGDGGGTPTTSVRAYLDVQRIL